MIALSSRLQILLLVGLVSGQCFSEVNPLTGLLSLALRAASYDIGIAMLNLEGCTIIGCTLASSGVPSRRMLLDPTSAH